ncbi:MAG: hypothetical protein WC762_01040 [Methylobacter sp.]|jgi:hypothetical protein
MKYEKFKTIDRVEDGLLQHLGLVKESVRIIKLDNYPDFDISGYDRHTERQYVFKDYWSFSREYAALSNASVNYSGVFHYDDIVRLSKEYEISFSSGVSEEEVLNQIRCLHDDLMFQDSIESEFDGFKLNDIKIERIDQFAKKVLFIGGYSGGYSEIQPDDWNIYIEIFLSGFVSGNSPGTFYVDLIAESYALKESGNTKLAYFIAFSALENFTNERLGAHDQEGRLKGKFSDLFRKRFISTERHQIYTSIVGEYDFLESVRHQIAHGNPGATVDRALVDQLILFVLVVMSSIDNGESTFDDLRSKIDVHL